jgi:hypothetical protein
VAVDDGAAFTSSTTVSLDVGATDAGSGVANVALSNDGTTWTEMPYAPLVDWSLGSDQATTARLTTASVDDGARTVYAKWRDANGHWSEAKTATVVLDTTAPTAGAPSRSLIAGTAVSSGRIMNRLAWTGSDAASGVARYELQQSTDGGPWATVAANLTNRTLDRGLLTRHSYTFRVRAVDNAGNVGAWATSSTRTLSRYNETSYWGGRAKFAKAAGAKATLIFTGRSVALVSRLGPTRGKVKIYLDGTRVATIDLYSSSYRNQRVVWARTFASAGKHRLSIVVSGTANRPRVDLDAIVVGR